MSRTSAIATVAALGLSTVVACDRGGMSRTQAGRPGGTLVIAIPADAGPIIPPYAITSATKLVVDQLFDPLAEIGDSLNSIGDRGFHPALAEHWTWARDSLSIAFHLNPRARWHDGIPVRASDVRFTYRLYRDTTAATSNVWTQIASIDSVTAPDTLTAVFWFRQRDPEQFFTAASQMYICPEHLLGHPAAADLRNADFGRHPVGSGRFRLGPWSRGSSLELDADSANYRGRAKLDRVILTITPDYTSALGRLFAGEGDFFPVVHVESLSELRRHPSLRAVPYQELSYGFLWFNLRDGHTSSPHPIFGDRTVRRALAMALDREAMARNAFDSLAVVPTGPFAGSAPFADATVIPLRYDPTAARRLLDSAGWRVGPDGIRAKHGHRLAFPIMVPTSSKVRVRYAQLIQAQLQQVGVTASVDALEFAAFVARLQARTFDAAINVWTTDASATAVQQEWATVAATRGMNWGSYLNSAFDDALDSGLRTTDTTQRRLHLHRAFQVITDDAPGVWLYEPKELAGVGHRLRLAYLRPDAWWAHLADWTIVP